MSGLRFRNLDADPTDAVETWPTEGLIAALERGGIRDWRRVATAVASDPWGPVARRLEDALAATQPYGVGPLMQAVLERARSAAEARERSDVARRVAALLAASGMSRAEFAESIGTSTSRLSTYLGGKVAPASTLLLRMERVAGDRARTREPRAVQSEGRRNAPRRR